MCSFLCKNKKSRMGSETIIKEDNHGVQPCRSVILDSSWFVLAGETLSRAVESLISLLNGSLAKEAWMSPPRQVPPLSTAIR